MNIERKKQIRVILIGVVLKSDKKFMREIDDCLEELALLSKTNFFEVSDTLLKKVNRYSSKFLLPSGSVEEIHNKIKDEKIDVAIFDNHLSPAQIKNLENTWKIKVIDRTDLILDIFENHATTKEAELQIELARLELLLPRLTRMWTHLDRQVGGIGVRGGEGEKQIERDRRDIKKKISFIKNKLKKVERNRLNQQKKRKNSFRIALVGYTNAGKSTLLNKLTKSKSYADDKLFATLDPRTKKWNLDCPVDVIITDTIGFIRRLPHNLIASFKSTLMEALNADVIWHVIDFSHPGHQNQMVVVMEILEEIGVEQRPVWNIYNKIDKVDFSSDIDTDADGIYISSVEGAGLNLLREKVKEYIAGERNPEYNSANSFISKPA